MNYLAELKAFYDTLAINSLSSPDIALWYALMSIANRSGWKTEFTVALSVLAFYSGSNESTVKRSRNKLAQCGYITWRPRNGNQSAVYHINSLVVHCEPQTVPQSGLQSEPQTVPQTAPINKTKLNETNNPPISPITRFDEFVSAYPKVVRNRQALQQAYAWLFVNDAHLTERDIVDAAKNYAKTCRANQAEDRYIKSPINFLKDGYFVDFLPNNYSPPAPRTGSFEQRDYNISELEKTLLGR